jgi:hypothetical protein
MGIFPKAIIFIVLATGWGHLTTHIGFCHSTLVSSRIGYGTSGLGTSNWSGVLHL